MKDTALYEHLPGLKAPWSVRQVDLSLADQRVVVEVVLKKGQVWADPTDPTKRAHINGWEANASGVTWTPASLRPSSRHVFLNSNTPVVRWKN